MLRSVVAFRDRHRAGLPHLLLVIGLYVLILAALFAAGRLVTAPPEVPGGGGLAIAAQELLGQVPGTDFLVDYAAAVALTHHVDAYTVSSVLIQNIGISWPVNTPDTHPPTMLTLTLPFTILSYKHALAAWALAMIFLLIATVHLVGVPWRFSVIVGSLLSLAMPGAYGIGNPVPVIGFGAMVAYRWRDDPLIAGLGIAVASAPKSSGLLLLVPFLLARRFAAAAWAVGFYAVFAALPLFFQPGIWLRYVQAGGIGIAQNQARSDNASLIHLAERVGIPDLVAVLVVCAAAFVLAVATRDTFWPIVWLMVALLPVAWMYSLLTLLPIFVRAIPRSDTLTCWLAITAGGLTVASPALGMWPVFVFPLVLLLTFTLIYRLPATEAAGFWVPRRFEDVLALIPVRQADRGSAANVRS